MARRYFNWKLAVVILIVLVVLGVTAFGLRKWQRKRMGYNALEVGLQAYTNRQWDEAAKNLGQYIAIDQTDVDVMLKYADAQLNKRPISRGGIEQAVSSYRIILRIDKSNLAAVEKLVEIYLQMNLASEAELIAAKYLEENDNPDIRRYYAFALVQQGQEEKIKQAVNQLDKIIKEHPENLITYDVLGQVTRRYKEKYPAYFQITEDNCYNSAVENNPTSAQAFIMRAAWRAKNNRYIEAKEDYEKAEKLDLSDFNDRMRLVSGLIDLAGFADFIRAQDDANEMFGKAKGYLKAVQANDMSNQLYWQVRAKLAFMTKSKDDMISTADEGLEKLGPLPWDFMPIAVELYIRAVGLEENAGVRETILKKASDRLKEMREKEVAQAMVAFLQGMVSELRQNDHEAVGYWHQAIRLGYNTEDINIKVANALARTGDNQSAIRQLRTLVREKPTATARYELAKVLGRAGNWAEAAAEAEQIQGINLNSMILHIEARMRSTGDEPTQANKQTLEELKKQLSYLKGNYGGSFSIEILRVRLAMKLKEFNEAQKILSDINVKEDAGLKIEIETAEAELFQAMGKSEEAIKKLYDLTGKYPENTALVQNLAGILVSLERNEEAEKVLSGAIQKTDNPVSKRELALLLARFYNLWGRDAESLQLITEISEKLPDDISLKRNLLRYKEVFADSRRADKIIQDIKKIEGEDGWQWRWEQSFVWYNGEEFTKYYNQIVSLLKENLVANPYDQASRMLLAGVYEKNGDLNLASSTYMEALQRSPDNINITVPLITTLYKMNEFEKADDLLKQALSKGLSHPLLSQLELQSYLYQQNYSSAEGVIESLAAKRPDDPNLALSLSLIMIEQRKYGQAREKLNEFKVKRPNFIPVTAALVRLNVIEQKYEEALSLCNEMIAQAKSASSYILRGNTYMMLRTRELESDNPEKANTYEELASEDFKNASVLEPGNIQGWVAKAHFNYTAGRVEKAIEDIKSAIQLDKQGSVQIIKRLIMYLGAKNDIDSRKEIDELLQNTLVSHPHDIELRMMKIRLLLTKGTNPAIAEAQRILLVITQEQPMYQAAWPMLAQFYIDHAQPKEAKETIERALTYFPNDRNLLILKARTEAAASPIIAISILKELLDMNPNDAEAAIILASTYLEAGEGGKGIAVLRTQLKNTSSEDEQKISLALAIALYSSGDKSEANQEFEHLYQTPPDDPRVVLAHTQMLQKDELWSDIQKRTIEWFQKHPQDIHTPVTVANRLLAAKNENGRKTGEDIIRLVLKSSPDSVEALTTLAMSLQVKGLTEESAKLYQKALELNSDNLIAANNLAWILCENLGKFKEALDVALPASQKNPDYVDLIDTCGVIYYRQGEYRKAVDQFNRCVELYPANSPVLTSSYFHLGRALADWGQNFKAIEYLEKAISLNGNIGGLSPEDLADANRILGKLQKN